MKIMSNFVIRIFLILPMLFVAPSLANAQITTQFCMLTSSTHGGSDSTNIYVNLTGISGSTTGKLNLNNVDENFVSGEWDCFDFQVSDFTQGVDVGFHTHAEIGFSAGGQDDFCITQVYSRRYENFNTQTRSGDLLSQSQFGNANKQEICFGDYNNNSRSSRTLVTRSSQPVATLEAVEMKWKKVSSQFGTGQLKFSTTWGAERTNEKTTTKQWEVAVTVAAEVEGKILGNGAKASTSVTASGGESYGLSEAVTTSNSQTIETVCSNNGEANNVTLYQWEYNVRHSDGTGDVKIPVKSFACVMDNPDPASFYPVCLPGCCDNAACTQCKSGQGYKGCEVLVNPQWYELASGSVPIQGSGTPGNCRASVVGDGSQYPTLDSAVAACNGNSSCTAVYETTNGFQQRTCTAEHQGFGWCNLSDTNPICNTAQGGMTYFLPQ